VPGFFISRPLKVYFYKGIEMKKTFTRKARRGFPVVSSLKGLTNPPTGGLVTPLSLQAKKAGTIFS
jgi:hypothetical protein